MQRLLGEIGDVRGHAGDREAARGAPALLEVIALGPFRVGHDRLAADLVEGNVLRGVARRRRDRHRREHAIGIARRPLQHLHPAHGAADHAKQALDPEVIDELLLCTHDVGDRDHRKRQAPGPAGRGIDLHGAARAHASPQHVRADQEIFFRVEHFAGSDQRRPPAGLARHGVRIGNVLVAGQGVTDQDRVRALGVERAVGLIGNGVGPEPGTTVEHQRLRHHEPMARALCRLAGSGLDDGCAHEFAN